MTATEREESPPTPTIGAAAGAGEGAVMGFVAYILFEDPAFAAAVGALSAVGGVLFLPYIMSLGAIREGTLSPDALPGPRSIHTGALGAALSSGAIVCLAVMFAVESPAESIAAALGYAAVSFLALRFVLPDAGSVADGDVEIS